MDIFMASCGGASTSIIDCSGGGDAGIWYIINLALNILTGMIGLLAVIGIILSGIQYTTSAGDVAKTTKAKRRIFEIVLGVIAYLVLYAILQFLIPGGFAHEEQIPVESISISLQKSSVYVGETTNANVTFTPENASNKTYSLYSSNNSVATASFGSVRCLKSGSATITALSSNNLNSTTTISCVTKPSDSGGGSGGSGGSSGSSSGSSQSFVEGSCKLDEMSGPRLARSKRALSEAEVRKCSFSQDPTYDDIIALFKQYGIEDGSNEAIAIVSWIEGEDYWAFGDTYLGYLSACVLINNIIDHKYGKNPLDRITAWGEYYTLANLKTRYNAGKTHQKTLKPLYLGLKYLYEKIYYCAGKYKDDNGNWVIPKNPVYTGKNSTGDTIYVAG